MSLLENKFPSLLNNSPPPPLTHTQTHPVPLPLSTICLGRVSKITRVTGHICGLYISDIWHKQVWEGDMEKERGGGEERGGEKSLWLNPGSVRCLWPCKKPFIGSVLSNTLTQFCETSLRLDRYTKVDFSQLPVMHTHPLGHDEL